jgi:hypothetical protein
MRIRIRIQQLKLMRIRIRNPAYGANLVQHLKTHHQRAIVKVEEERDLVEMVAVPTMTSDGILMF